MFTLRHEGGFSTVELLITLVVIGMVFVIFSELNTNTTSIVAKGEKATTASQAADRIVQYYENLSCASGTTTITECVPDTPSDNPINISSDQSQSEDVFHNKAEYSELLTEIKGSANVVIESHEIGEGNVDPAPTTLLKKVRVEVSYGSGGSAKVVKNTLLGLEAEGGSH